MKYLYLLSFLLLFSFSASAQQADFVGNYGEVVEADHKMVDRGIRLSLNDAGELSGYAYFANADGTNERKSDLTNIVYNEETQELTFVLDEEQVTAGLTDNGNGGFNMILFTKDDALQFKWRGK